MLAKIFLALLMSVSFSLAAEHWPTGYYQTVSDPENSYYYDDELRWYCHIQNDTQSSLYDVSSQVRIVGDIYSFLGNAVSLGECRWPDGFYSISEGDGTIYRLYPGNFCLITSPQMLDAYNGTDSVISAEPNSDFGAHRTFIGQCFWPTN